MNEPSITATIREHGLLKLVKAKLRQNLNYLPNIGELVTMNAVELERTPQVR